MDETLGLLRSVPLLERLSQTELAEVLASGEVVAFDAGTDLVREGDAATDVYVILSGRATVWVRGRHRQQLGPGDHFGEISVLDGGPRSATVRADEDVRVLRLGRAAFVDLLERHAEIGRALLVELSARLRAAEGVLVHW